MGVFYNEESPNHSPAKRCKCIAATLKEVLSQCRSLGGRLSTGSLEEDIPISDFDEEQEVELPHSSPLSFCFEKY